MRIEAKTALAALLATTIAGTALAQSDNANEDATDVEAPDVSAGADASGGAEVETPDTSTEADVSAGAEASDETSSDDISGDASAPTGADMNYGQLISGLRTSADAGMDAEADFEGVTEESTIEVVLLSDLKGNAAENAQALDEALSAQEENIDSLRSAIEANATISAALEEAGYSADDVVAYETTAMGDVTLIVDDSTEDSSAAE